jgi:hypothetical protein
VPMALARAGMPLLGTWLGDWRFLVVCGVLAFIASAALLPLVRVQPNHDEPAAERHRASASDERGPLPSLP